MKLRIYMIVLLACVWSGVLTAPVFASDVSTKCDTPTTQNLRKKAEAQMEKDIAPYTKATGAALAVVNRYKTVIEEAWSAMLQPYCGYTETASAIHSYNKSVTRARAAFVADIKHPESANIPKTVSVKVADAAVSVAASATETAGKKVSIKKTEPVPSMQGAELIAAGLHKGMRKDAVKMLQKKLAGMYHVSEDDLVTGFFGPKTESYVIRFQIERGIISSAHASAAGLVGPKTSRALNSVD